MAKNTNWRNQKRDPHTGRWIDASPGDAGNPNIPTIGPVQLIRTNEKPEQGSSRMNRPVDLPHFDVQAAGESVGTVHAALSTPRHVSQGGGQTKVWYSRKPGGRSQPHASKEGARDSLLKDVNHENKLAPGTSKEEKLAKRQELADRVNAAVESATFDNSVAAGGSGGYTANGSIEMSAAAQKKYDAWLDEVEKNTGKRKPGIGANAMKIRFINETNTHLTPAQRRALGDNLPTSKIGRRLLARDVMDSASARSSAQAGPLTPAEDAVRIAEERAATLRGQREDRIPLPQHAEYRSQVRKTFQGMSDQALDFQDTVVQGGIDREELDKEINRRTFDGGKQIESGSKQGSAAKVASVVDSLLASGHTNEDKASKMKQTAANQPPADTPIPWKKPTARVEADIETVNGSDRNLGWTVRANGLGVIDRSSVGWHLAKPLHSRSQAQLVADRADEISTLVALNEASRRSGVDQTARQYPDQAELLRAWGEFGGDGAPRARIVAEPDAAGGIVIYEYDYQSWAAYLPPKIGKASMDINTMYFEAAFDAVEGQLQRRGMNTLNSRDETLRALDRAEKAATKIPDRGKLNDDAFAIPETRSYPIPDEEHGKLALGRCKGKPEESRVRSAVLKKFPGLKDYAAKVLD